MNNSDQSVKYCYTCLSTDSSLISIFKFGMNNILQRILDVVPFVDEKFNYVCYKCRAMLRKFDKFKASCKQIDSALKKCVTDREICVNALKIDHFIDLSKRNVFCIDVRLNIPLIEKYNYFSIDSLECRDELEMSLDNSIIENEVKSEQSENEIPIIENELEFELEDSITKDSLKKIKLKKKRNKKKSKDTNSFEDENALKKYRKPRKCKISDNMEITKTKILKVYLTEEEQKLERQKRMSEEKYLNAPFRCDLCAIPFRREFTLNNHMEKHKEERGPFVCSVCQQRFGNERQFKLHTSIHSIRLVCNACGARLRDRGRLADHLAWHAGHKYSCKICNSTFICRTTLNNHVRVKHKDNEYKCQFCRKIFKVKERLKEHESRHSKSPAYSCNICDKQFYSAANLSNHKGTHSTMRHFYCVECDLYFKSASILKNHLEKSAKHIDPSSLRFSCDQCNKRFRTSDLLTQHIDGSHLKRKKFSCEICAASYASHQGLNFHRRLAHQGFRLPKSHLCTICQRSFTAKALLTNHMRVHTGEKPFECSECFRKFSQKSSLRTHIKLVHLKLKRVIKKRSKIDNQIKMDEEGDKVGLSMNKIEILNLYTNESKNWECKVTDNSLIHQEDLIGNVCDISVPINIEHTLYETTSR